MNATTPSEGLLNGTQLCKRSLSARIDASLSGPTASPPPTTPAKKRTVNLAVILPIVLVTVVALPIFTITIYCFYKRRYVDPPAPAKPVDGLSLSNTGAEISIFSSFGDTHLGERSSLHLIFARLDRPTSFQIVSIAKTWEINHFPYMHKKLTIESVIH